MMDAAISGSTTVRAVQNQWYPAGAEGTGINRRSMRKWVVVPAANPNTMMDRNSCSRRKPLSRDDIAIPEATAAAGGNIIWHRNHVGISPSSTTGRVRGERAGVPYTSLGTVEAPSSDPRLSHISGYPGTAGAEASRDTRLLQKPFSPAELLRAVRATLDRRRG